MMDERKVADYFVIAGVPDDPEDLDDSEDINHFKDGHDQAPIIDIGIYFPELDEEVPADFNIIKLTPTGLNANLNHGSIRSSQCYICYKRGRDKPPLVDIGVMYEGKEKLLPDAEVIKESFGKNIANVNNSNALTYITFRRGTPTMPCNALVVTDICVVIASRGESPPHAFCCIYKNLNKGIVGSDVFLCYKKSMNRPKSLTYKPGTLCRYPMSDLLDFPFPNSVPLFCLPMGASVEMWPKTATQPKPVFSTFVLTVSDAKHKVYGSAVTFYEKISSDKLSEEQIEYFAYEENNNFSLHVNKSICILSHWPFADTFESWLLFLHNMVSSGKPLSIPIERYIVQLLDEVPFPAPRTLAQLSTNNTVILTQPEDLPLPRSAAKFSKLLLNLGPENSLILLLLALTEQKILIHSLRPDTLTSVAEAVSSLLFPFKWQCPYIPLCPLGLVEVLNAPLPFLIGVDSRYFDLYEPPVDVSYVDLDTNVITVCEIQRSTLNIKLLPKRAAKTLRLSLEDLYIKLQNPANTKTNNAATTDQMEIEFQRRRREQDLDLQIQEAFLKFMALTLRGYRSYLLPITKAPTVGTTDPQALFQLNEFLRSRDKAYHKFFQLLMHTQMFIRFIEERSFVADGDQSLAFFDECTERLNNDESDLRLRLLEPDFAHTSERTVFLLPPEPAQGETYIYNEFTLDPLRLGSKLRTHLTNITQNLTAPSSPMTRRTKHEIKSAQKLARKSVKTPESWAKCLSGTCHTLYFMTLPSMLSVNVGKEKTILQQAYELLVRATQLKLSCDEVCFRLMMQLCGEHSKPLLAVKLLLLMKKSGIQPNALTYGLYNRCVLEAEWPAQASSSQVLWNKLRHVVLGAAHFRWAAKRQAARRLSVSTEGGSHLLDRAASRSSLDSHETTHSETGILEKLNRIVSIVRGVNTNDSETVVDTGIINTENTQEVDELESDTIQEEVQNTFTPPESPSEYLRLLSRSESAGDANIIDKLQQNSKKNCSRSLQFNGERNEQSDLDKTSPSKICRTLVTENDPLGALDINDTEVDPTPITNSITNTTNSIQSTDEPILFKTSVQRSATFEGSPPAQSKLHRSETVPASSVTSSLASLGSTIKINFSRYAPTRLSLRKADLKKSQLLIENAINNLSPSSLTGKKSNELIQGGISSLKSAATSVAKKLDEIKEAISTTSTPVKVLANDRLQSDLMETENESTDGSDVGDRQRKISGELGSYKGSHSNLKELEELPESLYIVTPEAEIEGVMDIILTSCSQCHNCLSLVYDEDIMANWFPEDSNLNTICQACSKPTVPLLTVTISNKDTASEPFSVPYLNPLVLRKELENVLTTEGDLSLGDTKFVEEHPIIYWNLMWIFERINVPTHLPNLCLKYNRSTDKVDDGNGNESDGSNKRSTSSEDCVLQPVEEGADPLTQELVTQATPNESRTPINVKCMWDDPRLHQGIPLYKLWKRRDKTSLDSTSRLMQSVVSSIYCNDLSVPLKKLASERQHSQRTSNEKLCSMSIYREILFLTCKAVGRSNIDLNAFDKQYVTAYGRQERTITYSPQDRPLNINSIYCRQYFKPLQLP